MLVKLKDSLSKIPKSDTVYFPYKFCILAFHMNISKKVCRY